MNIQEFSDAFDVFLNSYSKKAMFGDTVSNIDITLDEYEKSLYLTKMQEALVVSLYTGRHAVGNSFEETEESRRYLSNLIRERDILPSGTSYGLPIGMGLNSQFFTLPDDLWFITYEAAKAKNGKCDNTVMDVLPVTQDEYHKIKNNPFRGANDRRVLRLDLSDNKIEIVSRHKIAEYYIRYIKKIQPIILTDLPDGLTINGISETTESELHEGLHQQLLEMAVKEALSDRVNGINNASTK